MDIDQACGLWQSFPLVLLAALSDLLVDWSKVGNKHLTRFVVFRDRADFS